MVKSVGTGLVLGSVVAISSCTRERAHIPNGTFEYTVPMETEGNLVHIPISLNGAMPNPFILDTGVANVIVSQDSAREAGVSTIDRMANLTGIGEDVIKMSIAKNLLIDLDGLQWPIGEVMVAPHSLTQRLTETIGKPFSGMIGAQIFESYVVEIDFQAGQIVLYPPQNYRYFGSGQVIPLILRGRKPYIEATVQMEPDAPPITGTFLLDLGSNQALDVRGDLPVPSNLPKRYASGVGGEVLIPVGRVHRLQIGAYDIPNPVTAFESAAMGPAQVLSGRIGNQILSQFKVIFNYAHKQVILEPIQTPVTPIETDMSGLRLKLSQVDPTAIVVDHVYPNSPAQAAGILKGDRLVEIDGQPVSALTLSIVRQKLKGDPQAIRNIVLERNQARLFIRLELQRLI